MSIAAIIPKRLRHQDTPVDIARLYVPSTENVERKNTCVFIYVRDLVKVLVTAAMFAIRLGGAFWNPWKKCRAGAAVSMTLESTLHRICITQTGSRRDAVTAALPRRLDVWQMVIWFNLSYVHGYNSRVGITYVCSLKVHFYVDDNKLINNNI